MPDRSVGFTPRRRPLCIAIVEGSVTQWWHGLASLPQGSLVILRDYHHPERAALAAALAELCRGWRLRFLVAGDARLARRVKADGVHLPEGLAHALPALRRRFPQGYFTVAAHGPAALRKAARYGADIALLSPLFPTESHPGGRHLGVTRFRQMARKAPLPVAALGGISSQRLRPLRSLPIAGVAGIRLYSSAPVGKVMKCVSP
jgi:thiamine-phosphate pyrophosphorylase